MRRLGIVVVMIGSLTLAAVAPAAARATADTGKSNGKANGKSKAAAVATTFGVPRMVDPIHTYGEPDIKVAPNGDVHVSGPQGTGVQRSVWNVSKDGGDSWGVGDGVPATPGDRTPPAPAERAEGRGG